MSRREGETREEMALCLARSHGGGLLMERNIRPENGWRNDGAGFFFGVRKSPDAIQTSKESLVAVHLVC